MKVKFSDSGPCQKQVRVEVPPDRVAAEFDEVYLQLKKVAHVPGYRIGQAPRDLLERYHGTKAREEVSRRLVESTLDEALKNEAKLDLVGRPRVTELKFEPNQPMSYVAQMEVAPEVPLGKYKGLKLTKPKPASAEESLEKVLEHLRQTHAELKPLLENRPAADGDFLLVDLAEQRPGKPAQKRREMILHLNLAQDPEGVVKGLLGMNVGEERILSLKDGISLSVKLKTIKVKEVPPLDDALAKTAGSYETLDALKEAIRKDLNKQAEAAAHHALETQASKQLEENWKFDLPPTLVASHARRILKDRALELMNQGVSTEDVEKRSQILTDQAKLEALKEVKTFFILRRIASTEKIEASEQEMNEKLQAMAQRMQVPPEQLSKQLEERDLLEEMAWGIIRQKVLDLVIKEATVKEES